MTEGTFDSYSWQLIENKQKFIGQIMTSKSPVRSCEDVDETEAVESGTGAGLRARLARGCPMRTEKRPDSIDPFGRMKVYYRFWTELFHVYCHNYPSKGAGFF